jgi:hypothetical protein
LQLFQSKKAPARMGGAFLLRKCQLPIKVQGEWRLCLFRISMQQSLLPEISKCVN